MKKPPEPEPVQNPVRFEQDPEKKTGKCPLFPLYFMVVCLHYRQTLFKAAVSKLEVLKQSQYVKKSRYGL
jgi:hypothetical protein